MKHLFEKLQRGEVLTEAETQKIIDDWFKYKLARIQGGQKSKPSIKIDTPEAAKNRERVRKFREKQKNTET